MLTAVVCNDALPEPVICWFIDIYDVRLSTLTDPRQARAFGKHGKRDLQSPAL